jgi:hypothetical protein
LRIFLIELISIKTGKSSLDKNQLLCGILRILLVQINSKGIDKLENLNREIHHDRKNEKVAVIVKNIQITEICSVQFEYI